jgi:hypothetical protein
MNLKISDTLSLPPDAVTQTFAILGIRGSGKTNTAVVMFEEMVKQGDQCVVLDPTDAWYGVRSSHDGKAEGLKVYVFGGEHGDLPLEGNHGSQMADFVIESGASVVFSLRHLSMGDQRKFAADFGERLRFLKAKPENRNPLQLFLDEAEEFCLSEDTQILGRNGWASHGEIKVGMEVSCFDLETETYHWLPVERVIRREYTGKMISLRTRGVDALVTPDHRTVMRYQQRAQGREHGWYPWEFRDSGSLPQQIKIPCGGAATGSGLNIQPHLLRVIGWTITDGYIHQKSKSRNLGLQQSVATEKLGLMMAEEMAAVLAEAGSVGLYHRPARIYYAADRSGMASESHAHYFGEDLSSRIYDWLDENIHRIPRRILSEANREQLAMLYQGMMEGDGTDRENKTDWLCLYCGHNEGLADDFQELCVRLEVNSVKRLSCQNQWIVNVNNRKQHYVRQSWPVEYSGLTWDVTVPSGAFVVRRNGRVFVTGNCPQNIRESDPNTSRMFGAYNRMVRRDRNLGLGITLISQRPQSVNKEPLSQIETLVCHRLLHKLDRKAVKEAWIEGHDTAGIGEKFLESLASLEKGDVWIWSPYWLDIFKRAHIRHRETFDSSATPKTGERTKVAKVRAEVDLEVLRKKLSETIDKAKANDPTYLKRRIIELEKAVKEQPTSVPSSADLDKAYEAGRRDLLAHIKNAKAQLEGDATRFSVESAKLNLQDIQPFFAKVFARMQEIAGMLPGVAQAAPVPREVWKPHDVTKPSIRIPYGKPVQVLDSSKNGSGELTNPERRILNACAWLDLIGNRTPKQAAVAFIAGYTVGGGAFNNPRGALRTKGFIDYRGDALVLTDAGRRHAEAPDAPLTTAELHTRVLRQLPNPEQRILQPLLTAYPDGIDNDDLARKAGYEPGGGAFNNPRGRLRTLELVTYPERGIVRCSDWLFID